MQVGGDDDADRGDRSERAVGREVAQQQAQEPRDDGAAEIHDEEDLRWIEVGEREHDKADRQHRPAGAGELFAVVSGVGQNTSFTASTTSTAYSGSVQVKLSGEYS